jgi:hypothetical protein
LLLFQIKKILDTWFNKERRKRENKGKKERKRPLKYTKTSRWHYWYCWKDLDEMNLTTPRKVTNGDRSGPHERPKRKWAPTPLEGLCDPLRSLFVIFIGVVRFFLLRSLKRYWWCHQRSFGVYLVSFSFSFFVFSLSSFLLVIYEEIWEREKVKIK